MLASTDAGKHPLWVEQNIAGTATLDSIIDQKLHYDVFGALRTPKSKILTLDEAGVSVFGDTRVGQRTIRAPGTDETLASCILAVILGCKCETRRPLKSVDGLLRLKAVYGFLDSSRSFDRRNAWFGRVGTPQFACKL